MVTLYGELVVIYSEPFEDTAEIFFSLCDLTFFFPWKDLAMKIIFPQV